MGRFPTEQDDRESKRARVTASPLIGFSDEDKQGTLQPHDDALVVMLRIGGYDVKRVLVDQGSTVEVMYPDLYKGLNLKPEDLPAYDSLLVSFEGKTVIPKGMIRLPCTNRFRRGGGRLHCGRCIFPLYGHRGPTMASCTRGLCHRLYTKK